MLVSVANFEEQRAHSCFGLAGCSGPALCRSSPFLLVTCRAIPNSPAFSLSCESREPCLARGCFVEATHDRPGKICCDESGVGQTNSQSWSKSKVPAFGGDEPALPWVDLSGRPDVVPRGRGGPRLAGPNPIGKLRPSRRRMHHGAGIFFEPLSTHGSSGFKPRPRNAASVSNRSTAGLRRSADPAIAPTMSRKPSPGRPRS